MIALADALIALLAVPLLLGCGYLLVLILVSWATWRWIEEPLRHWFKRRARRAPAPIAQASQIT